MADFPEVPHASSSIEYIDETLISRARSGAVKVRRLQSAVKRVFHINLRGLTAARRDAINTLRASKRLTTLTLDWGPTSETNLVVVFGPNSIRWSQDGNRWDAELELLETG